MKTLTPLFITLTLILTTACTATKPVYIPVETHTRTVDTLHRHTIQTDTIAIRDSTALIQRGDTICLTKYHWRDRIKLRRDTVHHHTHDTIRTQTPVPYPVPATLTTTQRIKLAAATPAVITALILAVLCLLLLKRRNN